MSLLEEYKKLEELRKKDAEACATHYNSVDLPGKRTMSTDGSAAKQRIAEMKKLHLDSAR